MHCARRGASRYGVRASIPCTISAVESTVLCCRKRCEERVRSCVIIKGPCSCSGTPIGALAPRDIVSRAILAEMAATKARHVYLDVTHLGAEFVKRRFPTIYATCLRYDIDITEEWIPVSPRRHYMMGGVWADLNGATTFQSLCRRGGACSVCMERIAWRVISCSKDGVCVRAALAAVLLPTARVSPLSSQRPHSSGPIR